MNNNSSTAANLSGNTPNNQRQYEVSKKDLPLHCPMPGISLWNSHPRVYLPVEATGEASALNLTMDG